MICSAIRATMRVFLLICPFLTASSQVPTMLDQDPAKFYALTPTSLSGEAYPFEKLKNKVVLIVNVASKCGFTSQYKGLQELYTRLEDKDFIILGFPANQFGGQEPGSAAEIQNFCKLNYGVTFPIFAKGDVTGEHPQPVYSYLLSHFEQGSIGWNFEKILVGRDGRIIEKFKSSVSPENEDLLKKIQEALAK